MTDAAIHRVSRITVDLSVRLSDHSGSPQAFSPRDDKVQNWFYRTLNYAGAPLAGMALLGCRPFGPSPPRSGFLSTSAVILPSLAHCCLKPTRKPMTLLRVLGLPVVRAAERRNVPALFQDPPRITREEPDAGPLGSVLAPEVYTAYQSAVHSHTFPCISKKPHGLAENCPTSTVWLGSAP